MIKKFYNKHTDAIELTRAYLGVVAFFLLAYIFNWIPHNIDGLLNSQTEQILYICLNGGGCP